MPAAPPAIRIEAAHESWPLREAFTISRGAKTSAEVITVTARDGAHSGKGEAVPYARYGESVEGALAALNALPPVFSRQQAQQLLPAGAARNALDCALWDLEAKRQESTAATLVGVGRIEPLLTCYTLSLGTPQAMAAKAASVAKLPLLKLKLGGVDDDERMRAVRAARPGARLVADANEAWTSDLAPILFAAAAETGVELIEQPFPAGQDDLLRYIPRTVAVCADESLHTRADLARFEGLYDAINIKLDKTGGLTQALELKREAQSRGLRIMVGSMVSTSLGVAPAMLLGQGVEWVDLDGPLLLARDREYPIAVADGIMAPPDRRLWG